MTIEERARSVESREELVAFLEALHADYEANPGMWTNVDLKSFLQAMAAWSQDMGGFYENTGADVSTVPLATLSV